MIFVADESVDQPIVVRLRASGHVVHAVVEMEPGISDPVVLELARERRAPLITADKDFGELVFRQKRLHTGVVLLRLIGLTPDMKADIVAEAVKEYGGTPIRERLKQERRED